MTLTLQASAAPQPGLVHYLPVASTMISAAFLVAITTRATRRGWPPHLAWWAVGVFFYGLGTALESTITIAGNTAWLTKSWYVAGALLGGYPLATGSVYLLMNRRPADILTACSLIVVVTAGILVLLSPVDLGVLEPHRPSGEVLGWQWVRLLTPFINVYAAIFLVGGAAWSAIMFAKDGTAPLRTLGTALIAVGGILPGIGGGMAKGGIVEALYVGELVGIILIWAGFEACNRSPVVRAHADAQMGRARAEIDAARSDSRPALAD